MPHWKVGPGGVKKVEVEVGQRSTEKEVIIHNMTHLHLTKNMTLDNNLGRMQITVKD